MHVACPQKKKGVHGTAQETVARTAVAVKATRIGSTGSVLCGLLTLSAGLLAPSRVSKGGAVTAASADTEEFRRRLASFWSEPTAAAASVKLREAASFFSGSADERAHARDEPQAGLDGL